MPTGTLLYDESAVAKSLEKMAEEIVKDIQNPEDLVVVGVQTRGVELSLRLAHIIKESIGIELETGFIDVSFHRDDLKLGQLPQLKETSLDIDIDGRQIILVDDVLFTGRTTKAALETLMAFGRPASIKLAVLVDRGGRELPIQPDYCCFEVPTERQNSVKVFLSERDGEKDSVKLFK